MPDYRDFAIAFYSKELLLSEGWMGAVTLAAFVLFLIVTLIVGNLTKNKFAVEFGGWLLTVFLLVYIAAAYNGPKIVESFNRIIAEHNIALKYDTSKVEFLKHNKKDNSIEAVYVDEESNARTGLRFTFEKGDSEPFLVDKDLINNPILPENVKAAIVKTV